MQREKRKEEETPMTEVAAGKHSIYVDVMSSTAVEAEEDDPQVESETPYVTLEFEAKENEHNQVYIGLHPIEDPSLLLESQETRL